MFPKHFRTLASVLFLILSACAPLPATGGQAPAPGATAEFEGQTAGGLAEFLAALRAAGATVEETIAIVQPFIPVTGQGLSVNGADVQAFEFASVAERQAVSEAISEAAGQVVPSIPEWADQATVWADRRLIVAYVGQDEALIGLVTGALGDPLAQTAPSDTEPPAAVLEARRWLAEQLSQGVEQVEIVQFEPAEWPDACLGLGRPDEGCAQAITPGWRVVFRLDGQDYEVRTNQTGSEVRLGQPSAPDALAGTSWRFESYGPPDAQTPVVEGSRLTLSFGANGQATGQGGCNSFGGQYKAEARAVSFGEIVHTERACLEEALNRQDQIYFDALQTVAAYTLVGDRLILVYDGGVLAFVSAAAPAAAGLCSLLDAPAESDWQTCENQTYGFAVQFPPGASLKENAEQSARIDLPFAPGTNLTEKYLALAVTAEGEEACSNPLAQGPPPEGVTTETVRAGDLAFVKQPGSEAATGDVHDFTAYSTARERVCVSLTFVLRSHAPELEPTPPAAFDAEAEAAIFEEIVATFRWSPA